MSFDATTPIHGSLQEELAYLSAQLQIYLFENYSPQTKIEMARESAIYFATSKQPEKVKYIEPVVASKPPSPTTVSFSPPKAAVVVPKRRPLPSFTDTSKTSALPSPFLATSMTLSESAQAVITKREEMVRLLKKTTPHLEIVSLPTAPLPPAIAILALGETKQELQLLHHLALSISTCFDTTCRVANWADLDVAQTKVILAPASRLKDWLQLPAIPMISLPELSLCIQQPALKASLWFNLCQQVQVYV